MEYESRRCLPYSLSYPSYYTPQGISHTTRTNPNGYTLGGPVGGMPYRMNVGRDDMAMESGSARRRIAVACARCRKRKIRCSGDPGNGSGCTNCKQAGIDASQCQFHRVGSDNVHKVIGDLTIAQSLTDMANASAGTMMPIYSTGDNPVMYSRSNPSQQYTQLNTKAMYPPGWSVPYTEETSPVESYPMDHATSFLPSSGNMSDSGIYAAGCRWSRAMMSKPMQQMSPSFLEESSYTQGIQYSQSNMGVPEPQSPLSMSSLQLTLPERPLRQPRFVETTANQRQLPIPQPSPAQSSRNIVDQMQDKRLRSVQGIGASTLDAKSSYTKSLSPWNLGDTTGNTSDNAQQHTPGHSEDSSDLSHPTEGKTELASTTSPVDEATLTPASTSQMPLSFSSAGMLDSMSLSMPTPTYSNVRENRVSHSSSAHMARHDSQSNLYSYNIEQMTKRRSSEGDSSNCGTLVSGHAYTPLNHAQAHDSTSASDIHHGSYDAHGMPLYRASSSNIKGGC